MYFILTEVYDEIIREEYLNISRPWIFVYVVQLETGVIFNNGYGSSVKLCMPHGICVDIMIIFIYRFW